MITMEIEITDKKNNPFFKRTEVQFVISHENQGTPSQAIIRNELAQELNAKKENIIINRINSRYGVQQTKGYAKIYNSRKEAESVERKHLLKRNKAEGKKEAKKEGKTEEAPAAEPTKEEVAKEGMPEEKPDKEKASEEKKEE